MSLNCIRFFASAVGRKAHQKPFAVDHGKSSGLEVACGHVDCEGIAGYVGVGVGGVDVPPAFRYDEAEFDCGWVA